jgi:LacI family repressor for deo operon, udp, cdd, tsx, nupC, and nupG
MGTRACHGYRVPRSAAKTSRASIVDVAARAGVSVATVSRALRQMPNVSAATRERVLRAAAELDYSASPLAAGLVTGRVRSVGVVSAYCGRWFFAEVVRGIEEALRECGYDLVLHILPDETRREQFFGELPVRRRVDAVIVCALPLVRRELDLLHALDLPLAMVGMGVDGVHSECVDDVAASRLAVQHLVNLGHRRIAMIGGDEPGASSWDRPPGEVVTVPALRARGYYETLAAAGLEAPEGWQPDGGFTVEGGERAMSGLLAQPGGPPTAVFCQSDEMAFGAIRALRRSGLRCPEDVSIVGFDDHELAEHLDVSTVGQSFAEQGASAVKWLMPALDGHPRPAEHSLHAFRLIPRGSTRSWPAR